MRRWEEKAKFCHSSWLNGRAPLDIALSLFKIAWRKNRTVREDLEHQSWTRGLWRMTTIIEIAEFVKLWDMVHHITLSNNRTSLMMESFSQDSIYSAFQWILQHFQRAFNLDRTRGKHKFFCMASCLWQIVYCRQSNC
ncbi:hypothetical protein HU200_036219 [Digitaria exilis]|uniref:Uncharacterized protein n=1 Tax=Digitaria exilis TaxID=1010633 RepID=A0A835BGF4_9POAL|nr:hypothetical protein HU200_036219 [Digitaria exilis]